MKIAGILFIILAITCVSPAYAAEVEDGLTDPATPIEVRSGQVFLIYIRSNPTTGYQWQLASPVDIDKVAFIKSEYIRPDKRLMGAPGVEKWVFKARNPGNTKISFKYIRVWENGIPPVERKEYTIIIKTNSI